MTTLGAHLRVALVTVRFRALLRQAAIDRTQPAIYRQKHDGQTANPNSASSKRMQADVQRNVNQQAHIKQGVATGSLTTAETGMLERGQARVNHKEAVAGANGHVGPVGGAPTTHAARRARDPFARHQERPYRSARWSVHTCERTCRQVRRDTR